MDRVLYAPFVLLAFVMSMAYLFGDADRTATKSFHAAQSVAPMRVWGIVFLLGAFAITLAILWGSFHVISVTLFVGGMVYSWWAILFLVSAFNDPKASLTGWAIHGFISCMYYFAAWKTRVQP